MECVHVQALGDEQLLAFILENQPLPQGQLIHLALCPSCQQRLKYYQMMHRQLFQALYSTHCPTSLQLSFYCAQKMLPQAEVDMITLHLKYCARCSTEVTNTRSLLNTFDPLPYLV